MVPDSIVGDKAGIPTTMWWGRSSAEEEAANDLITDGGGDDRGVLPGIVVRAWAVGPGRRRSLPSGDGREREARHRPEIGTGRRRHAIDRAAAGALCLVERSKRRAEEVDNIILSSALPTRDWGLFWYFHWSAVAAKKIL
jgi:hypothetical protein